MRVNGAGKREGARGEKRKGGTNERQTQEPMTVHEVGMGFENRDGEREKRTKIEPSEREGGHMDNVEDGR